MALLPSPSNRKTDEQTTESKRDRDPQKPPVKEGDQRDVEIEDVGEQGDGIARVGLGYVVIVSGTEIGEHVSVEITEFRENMAFAEVVEQYDSMR